MLEKLIMQIRRPKGVLGERGAFLSRAARANAAAHQYKLCINMLKSRKLPTQSFPSEKYISPPGGNSPQLGTTGLYCGFVNTMGICEVQ